MSAINNFSKIGHQIEHSNELIRIDSYLSKKFPFLSRTKWQKRIKNSEICIMSQNETKMRHIKSTYRLKKYDQIWYQERQIQRNIHIAHQSIDVLYDDGDLCIFSKPPHMVVHPVSVYGKNNFITHIHNMGYKDCAPVHRIDRETSGILVCARQSNTRSQISKLFREGTIQKFYLAITKGNSVVSSHFNISSPIGSPEKSLIRLKLWINGQNSIPALTECHTLAKLEDYNLFACFPKTGRTNQIRIHLASIGQWIVGDKMYHPNENVFLEFHAKGYTDWVHENVLFPRHLLHNAGILIPGFLKNFIIAPIPEDMLDFSMTQKLLELSGLTKDLSGLQSEEYLNIGEFKLSKVPNLKNNV